MRNLYEKAEEIESKF